jgi:hypothetical protein
MALFNKPITVVTKAFVKDEVLADIKSLLDTQFASYKYLEFTDKPWDLLIIRSVPRTVVLKMGKLGLHESTKELIVQEIFAVSVLSPDDTITEELEKSALGWTKTHLIVSDAATVKRKLLEA